MKFWMILSAVAMIATPEPSSIQYESRPEMTAKYTEEPVKIDGILDDEAWKSAIMYPLYLSEESVEQGNTLYEPGEVRLAWDDQFLYVGFLFYDSDIVAEGTADQELHFLLGDLAEVFLKPEANTWYWELYATPHGKKSHLWFPGSGRMGLKSNEEYDMELHVAAQCQGTLNDWRDRDTSWTAEMAIPIHELKRHGDDFGTDAKWTILVSRYNYSCHIPIRGPELSMTPQLPITVFHYHDGYAALRLVK